MTGKVINIICKTLSTLILIIAIGCAGSLILPQLAGYKIYSVVSGSMEPKYPVGSVVYIKPVEFDKIEVGDPIAFHWGSKKVVTHQVVEINKENQTFTTQGVANNVADGSPVAYSDVIGKGVYNIPFIGYITIYMQTVTGYLIAGCILIFIILLYIIPEIFSTPSESKESAVQKS